MIANLANTGVPIAPGVLVDNAENGDPSSDVTQLMLALAMSTTLAVTVSRTQDVYGAVLETLLV
jgi:hypothetical protein